MVDASFQPCYCPKAPFEESKIYFSGKHYSYGIKRTFGHALDGRVVFVLPHIPGAVYDMSNFTSNVHIFHSFLDKQEDEHSLNNPDPNEERWAMLADKGYTGANAYVQAILPFKKKNLLQHEEEHNKKVSREHIICENYYGRLKSLWTIMTTTYRSTVDTVLNTAIMIYFQTFVLPSQITTYQTAPCIVKMELFTRPNYMNIGKKEKSDRGKRSKGDSAFENVVYNVAK